MKPELENASATYTPSRKKVHAAESRWMKFLKFFSFVVLWAGLIVGGLYTAQYYMNHLQNEIKADITRQNQQQLTEIRQDYNHRLQEMETSLNAEINSIRKEVETFNELLTFTQDIADNRADESNKLYTRLQQLEKQLDELKKNLEVLK